jgi:actin-related protein
MLFAKQVLECVFKQCNVDPSQVALVVVQPRPASPSESASVMELLLDHFSVAAAAVVLQTTCVTEHLPVSCSVVLHVGATQSTALSRVDSHVYEPSFMSSSVGGADCTEYLQRQMDWASQENTPKMRNMVNDIKEKHSFCRARNDAQEPFMPFDYELPDESIITVGDEVGCAAEVLFNPSLIGRNRSFGVASLVAESIGRCATMAHSALWENIFVSGGSSQIPGFAQRLQHELAQWAGSHSVFVSGEYSNSEAVWRGACFTASQPHLKRGFVSRDEYNTGDVGKELLGKIRLDGLELPPVV